MGKSTISMAIFNSYVSLPEGKTFLSIVHRISWDPTQEMRQSSWNKCPQGMAFALDPVGAQLTTG